MQDQKKIQIWQETGDLALSRMEKLVEDAQRGGGLDNKTTEIMKYLSSIAYKAEASIAMIEGGGDGYSERSYADGMSGRRMRRQNGQFRSGYDGMSGDGMSNRSYDDGGYSGHGDQQYIQQMKRLLEQMEQG